MEMSAKCAHLTENYGKFKDSLASFCDFTEIFNSVGIFFYLNVPRFTSFST